jgi:hypothetical protein
MAEVCAGGGKDRFQVLHYLMGFGGDIGCFDVTGLRIDGDLTGDEKHRACLDGLGIGPDGSGRVWCIDDLFFHDAKIVKLGQRPKRAKLRL